MKLQLLDFLKLIVASHSGISSKRICGVIGFFVIVFIILYCTFKLILAPDIIEPFIFAICLLLGIDSVTGIFKKFSNNEKK